MEPGRGLVLVVEDERAIADLIAMYLRRDGFGVHVAGDGESALAQLRRLKPVAVILDVGLPKLDGIEVCRTMRANGDWTPVLFVTARDDEVDRVLGLELGADDYVTKPFSPRELAARVRTVLRRRAQGPPQPVFELGRHRLDPQQRRTWADGREIDLTPTEFDLLAHLMRNRGRVFDREPAAERGLGLRGSRGNPHRGRAHRAAEGKTRRRESDQDGSGRRLLGG